MESVSSDKKNTTRKERRNSNRKVMKIIGIIGIFLMVAAAGYFWYGHELMNRYDKIQIITVKREGIGMRELAKAFLPEINERIGVKMIKEANGFVSEDITFLIGQRVRIPIYRNLDIVREKAIMINQLEP